MLDSYVCTNSYLILKSKNVVKFYVHISPIFSCWVTCMIIELHVVHCLYQKVIMYQCFKGVSSF